MMYSNLKKILFNFDPELVHNFTMSIGKLYPESANLFLKERINAPVHTKNLNWNNQIGLAAGFDKNADYLPFLDKLGFGAIEIGTVTKVFQKGNPTPRIWRDIKNESIFNAMGFPSKGSDYTLNNLKNYQGNTPIGVNIGKNKLTKNEDAHLEYTYLYEMFAPFCDYIVINISSPNTPGLRQLAQIDDLKKLLAHIQPSHKKHKTPLFLKISPDMDLQDLSPIYEVCRASEISGIIATNTTIQHDRTGGMSGRRLWNYSKPTMLELLKLNQGQEFDLIICGGIGEIDQIKELKDHGAKLFQIYSSFIYQGPEVISKLAKVY